MAKKILAILMAATLLVGVFGVSVLAVSLDMTPTGTHVFQSQFGHVSQESEALDVIIFRSHANSSVATASLSGENPYAFRLGTGQPGHDFAFGLGSWNPQRTEFTVSAVAGLAPGTYTATLTVDGPAVTTPRTLNLFFTVNEPEPENDGSSLTWLWILIAILVAAAVAVVAAWLFLL